MWSKRLSRATRAPSPSSSSARPRASRCSSVRAWTPNARVRLDSVSRRSSTVTSTPACARSPASRRPVGPAPTMATEVVESCMVIHPRSKFWGRFRKTTAAMSSATTATSGGTSANQPTIASGAVPSSTSPTSTPVRAGSQAARTSATPLTAPIAVSHGGAAAAMSSSQRPSALSSTRGHCAATARADARALPATVSAPPHHNAGPPNPPQKTPRHPTPPPCQHTPARPDPHQAPASHVSTHPPGAFPVHRG